MAPVALVARPRFWLAGALLAVTLSGRHQPERSALAATSPPAIVIQLQPGSDLAILTPEVEDPINSGVAPLAAWIEHFLLKLL